MPYHLHDSSLTDTLKSSVSSCRTGQHTTSSMFCLKQRLAVWLIFIRTAGIYIANQIAILARSTTRALTSNSMNISRDCDSWHSNRSSSLVLSIPQLYRLLQVRGDTQTHNLRRTQITSSHLS